MSKWDDPVFKWYQYHKEDYENVRDRLKAVRNVMLNGREDAATDILEKATVWSVLSIQTALDRHEDAYVRWDSGTRLDEIASATTYGWQKADWLQQRHSFDYAEAVSRLRTGGPEEARDYIANNFTGLSYTKASFALAMLGIWELICIDSNTRQIANEQYGLDVPKKIRSASTYNEKSKEIIESTSIDAEPFIVQWAMYSLNKGEHFRHMPFYRSVLYR